VSLLEVLVERMKVGLAIVQPLRHSDRHRVSFIPIPDLYVLNEQRVELFGVRVIITPSAIIVAEGKRTEPSATVNTTYMVGPNQMLRHLDAAWEIRGDRRVYGILIVEAIDDLGKVPSYWREAAAEITASSTVQNSLPHRGPGEQIAISNAFVGVTTWQAVCQRFHIPTSVLLETIYASSNV
jgi:hypothetical protein